MTSYSEVSDISCQKVSENTVNCTLVSGGNETTVQNLVDIDVDGSIENVQADGSFDVVLDSPPVECSLEPGESGQTLDCKGESEGS